MSVSTPDLTECQVDDRINNNHMRLEYHCGHRKLVSVKGLIVSLSPNVTIYEVVRRAKCSHCHSTKASDFRILYVCRMKVCVFNKALP